MQGQGHLFLFAKRKSQVILTAKADQIETLRFPCTPLCALFLRARVARKNCFGHVSVIESKYMSQMNVSQTRNQLVHWSIGPLVHWSVRLPRLKDHEPPLRDALSFFKNQNELRLAGNQTVNQLAKSLQEFLDECHKKGKLESDKANHQFVVWLNDYMRVAGLRVACISSRCNGAPSFLRFVRSQDRDQYFFRTEHIRSIDAKTETHGRQADLPKLRVGIAPLLLRVDSVSKSSKLS